MPGILIPRDSIGQMGVSHCNSAAAISESHLQSLAACLEAGIDSYGRQRPILSEPHQFLTDDDHIRE